MKTISIAIGAMLIAAPLYAQGAGYKPTNLKVLPKNTTRDSIHNLMETYERQLGVRCEYCHIEKEGADRNDKDYALDTKAEKTIARQMMRMTNDINAKQLTRIKDRVSPAISVDCFTCHRGVAEPRPLNQELMTAYAEAGADSAEKAYRNLRTRYYGRAAYDFSEQTLAAFARQLQSQGKADDAMRFYKLNVDVAPQSIIALRILAGAQLAAHDTASAVASLQKALSINPNDRFVQRSLQQLKRP